MLIEMRSSVSFVIALFLLVPLIMGTALAQTDDEDTLFVPDDPIIYNVGVDLFTYDHCWKISEGQRID